jgi:hypothetical protein
LIGDRLDVIAIANPAQLPKCQPALIDCLGGRPVAARRLGAFSSLVARGSAGDLGIEVKQFVCKRLLDNAGICRGQLFFDLIMRPAHMAAPT